MDMRRFEMDHSTRFSFFAFHAIYTRITGYMCIGAVVMALISAQLGLFWPAACLTVAAIMSLSFTVWITWCYEKYLHSKYPLNRAVPERDGEMVRLYVGPSSYTTTDYAITYAFGLTALITFQLGLMLMVVELLTRGR